MIAYNIERWVDYVRDCRDLWEEMHEDHASNMTLNPDFQTYESLDAANKLRILTVRDDGKMIGYIIFVLYNHPHHVDQFCANEDSFYLSKAHRKGIAGVKMIRESVRRLAAEGVRRAFFTTDAMNDSGPLLEAIGFTKSNIVYSKWIS